MHFMQHVSLQQLYLQHIGPFIFLHVHGHHTNQGLTRFGKSSTIVNALVVARKSKFVILTLNAGRQLALNTMHK